LVRIAKRDQPISLAQLVRREPHILDYADEEGRNALHYCVAQKKKPSVKALLDAGCDPNASTLNGNSALHIAAKQHDYETLEMLLDWTSKTGEEFIVNHCNANGENPFHILFASSASPPAQTFKKMLKKEISQNGPNNYFSACLVTPNSDGETPLDLMNSTVEDPETLLELQTLAKFYLPSIIPEILPENQFRIQIVSDVHIEFGKENYDDSIVPKAKYLALLGDIGLPYYRSEYRAFIHQQAKKFEKVIVLAGNHEYYGASLDSTTKAIRDVCKSAPNQNVLFGDQLSVLIDGVRILACTLWSDVQPESVELIETCLSDYKHIKKKESDPEGTTLRVADTVELHKQDLQFLSSAINTAKQTDEPVMVLTHHAPSLRMGMCSPQDLEIREAFCSDLSSLYGAPVQVMCHGHTHWFKNICFKGTRFISNPKGYIQDNMPYDPSFIVTINQNK